MPALSRPGGRGAQRHRRDLLPARCCCGRPQRLRPARRRQGERRRCRSGRWSSSGWPRPGGRDQAQLPAARRGSRGRACVVDRAAGGRWRALAAAGLAALAGGGYWYLRNLAHTGNPLPWFDHLGPISLPAPEQALGGREGHSVLGYLTDGSVWSDWFLPGLHHGLDGPLAAARSPLALAGLAPLPRPPAPSRVLRVAAPGRPGRGPGLAVAPTSASGPEACRTASSPACATSPRPWSSASRCCPTTPPLRDRLDRRARAERSRFASIARTNRRSRSAGAGRLRCAGWLRPGRGWSATRSSATTCENRYANPTSRPRASMPPSSGRGDLRRPHRHHQHPPVPALRHRPLQPRRVTSAKSSPTAASSPPTPAAPGAASSTRATTTTSSPPATASNPASPHTHPRPAGPKAPARTVVLRKPPTVVFKLTGPLDPSACRWLRRQPSPRGGWRRG